VAKKTKVVVVRDKAITKKVMGTETEEHVGAQRLQDVYGTCGAQPTDKGNTDQGLSDPKNVMSANWKKKLGGCTKKGKGGRGQTAGS